MQILHFWKVTTKLWCPAFLALGVSNSNLFLFLCLGLVFSSQHVFVYNAQQARENFFWNFLLVIRATFLKQLLIILLFSSSKVSSKLISFRQFHGWKLRCLLCYILKSYILSQKLWFFYNLTTFLCYIKATELIYLAFLNAVVQS